MSERGAALRALRLAWGALRTLHPSRASVIVRDALGLLPNQPRDVGEHLASTMAWLRTAHDAGGGEGVSAGYSFIDGWLPPYPETTGYIIPTFFAFSRFSGESDFADRAVAMADWECRVQMPSGGVQGGLYGKGRGTPTESVFNTGQVILGWCRAFEETGAERFRESAQRAGAWLCSVQEADGSWGRYSPETKTQRHSYDSRTAWALLELARLTGETHFADAAQRQLAWVLSTQSPNGWFSNAEFYPPPHRWGRVFTHTIAYVLEGLIEAWRLTGHSQYLEAATAAADRLSMAYRSSSRLAGDFTPEWSTNARYSCLTGSAQTAGVFLRIAAVRKRPDLKDTGIALLRDVMGTQDLGSRDPALRGGVKGSHPLWGRYTPFVYPNWAAKFLADSLLLAVQTPR